MPNFKGNRGTKTILENREHKNQIFDFRGTGEQANLFQGTREQDPPPPPPRKGIIIDNYNQINAR